MVAKYTSLSLVISLLVFILFKINAAEIVLPQLDQNKKNSLSDFNEKFDLILKSSLTLKGDKIYKTNLVDYKKLVSNKEFSSLDSLLKNIGSEKASKKEQLATWLNIYNYLAMKKVVDNFGIKKLSDLNKGLTRVWHQNAGIINGSIVSLDTVEHKIIRAKYKESRVHFALVCAALSCPNLSADAYSANNLDSQLEKQLSEFVKNTHKGMKIDDANKTIYLSKIFKWFSEDFGDVKNYLTKKGILNKSQSLYKLKYLDYNWNLNSL